MGIKRWIQRNLLVHFQKQTPIFVSVTESQRLSGRTALITGGTSGIGFAIAKSYLKAGCKVIVCGRKMDKLKHSVKELDHFSMGGGNTNLLKLDISNIPEMEVSLTEYLENTKDRIDILVNCAGTNSGDIFGSIKEEDFDQVINTNLKGTLFVSQMIANYMKKNKISGNILNVISTGAFRPANTAYRISKWGLRGLTIGMAKSLIPYGIVVNGIAPGPTATNMLQASNDDLTRLENPAGRMATAEEVAELAVHLVSQSGKLIVGEIVSLSGGAGTITFDDITY